jgi:hypothetical protein
LADEIHVTISQGDKVIDTTDVTLHEHSAVESRISFALSETDSLSLSAGRAKIQVNWIYTDNNVAVRMSTKAATVPYLEQILDEEILPEEENNG